MMNRHGVQSDTTLLFTLKDLSICLPEFVSVFLLSVYVQYISHVYFFARHLFHFCLSYLSCLPLCLSAYFFLSLFLSCMSIAVTAPC
jgi:hypothetical protein